MHRSLLSSLFLRKDHWTSSISSIRAETIITGIRLPRRRKWHKSRRRTPFAPCNTMESGTRKTVSIKFQGNFSNIPTFLLPHSNNVWEDFSRRRFWPFPLSSPLYFFYQRPFFSWGGGWRKILILTLCGGGGKSTSPLIFFLPRKGFRSVDGAFLEELFRFKTSQILEFPKHETG